MQLEGETPAEEQALEDLAGRGGRTRADFRAQSRWPLTEGVDARADRRGVPEPFAQ